MNARTRRAGLARRAVCSCAPRCVFLRADVRVLVRRGACSCLRGSLGASCSHRIPLVDKGFRAAWTVGGGCWNGSMIEVMRQGTPVEVDGLDAEWVLDLARDAELMARQAERAKLRAANRWVDLNAATAQSGVEMWGNAGALDCEVPIGGPGTPALAAFSGGAVRCRVGDLDDLGDEPDLGRGRAQAPAPGAVGALGGAGGGGLEAEDDRPPHQQPVRGGRGVRRRASSRRSSPPAAAPRSSGWWRRRSRGSTPSRSPRPSRPARPPGTSGSSTRAWVTGPAPPGWTPPPTRWT